MSKFYRDGARVCIGYIKKCYTVQGKELAHNRVKLFTLWGAFFSPANKLSLAEQRTTGQKKKVLLAKSLCEKAHLYIWDEPLNYIDVLSRIQIENLLLEYAPTLLFVEHDRTFTDKIATKIVHL